MTDSLPFFLTWLVTWIALMAYLWRLEAKLKGIEIERDEGLRKGDEKVE